MPIEVVDVNKKKVCKDCKYHKNKPSYCKKFYTFVPRKKSDCREFVVKK